MKKIRSVADETIHLARKHFAAASADYVVRLGQEDETTADDHQRLIGHSCTTPARSSTVIPRVRTN